MENNYTTERLSLSKLCFDDYEFISQLVNTLEWIKFIGDRNIKTEEDAKNYVQKIIDNPNVIYWAVKLKTENTKIGIITFIKRDYLEHNDIGFAFLPKYAKKGYAYEATIPVLKDAINNKNHNRILATTIKENINSIKLLEKLGLSFKNEIEVGKDLLQIYSTT
jgi:RimJ/RimL family protein N-acetyltransferase|nr:GNAT family N-acetyltransferase [uncultured Flavobacterium sp.]